MNTQTDSLPESLETRAVTPAAISRTQPFYWSVRREIWENRSIYLAPLAVAGLFLLGFLINLITLHHRLGISIRDATLHRDVEVNAYQLAGAVIMGTAIIVGFFYSLDALYGERRDRTILFWKSLPVSDLTTVLAKITVPLVILPIVCFLVAVATQFIVLLLSSIVLLGSGGGVATLWSHASFFHFSLVLLYHIFTVHGLWYAPIYGWLILISAWAPRAPFLWAVLPPFVISGLEKITFNTTHFLALIQYRFSGPQGPGPMQAGGDADFTAHLIPHGFFTTPGLWTGLLVGAAFLYAAVRIRRYRGPI